MRRVDSGPTADTLLLGDQGRRGVLSFQMEVSIAVDGSVCFLAHQSGVRWELHLQRQPQELFAALQTAGPTSKEMAPFNEPILGLKGSARAYQKSYRPYTALTLKLGKYLTSVIHLTDQQRLDLVAILATLPA